MKKIIIVVPILLLASFCLAAFTVHPDGSDGFTLQAYYKGQNQLNKVVSFTIVDRSGSSVYHGGTASVSYSNTENPSFSFEPIFSWELDGVEFENSCSITMKFTFTALMAYVDGYDKYYIPEHKYTMTGITCSSGSTFSQSAQNMKTFPQKTGNYQYPEYRTNDIYRSVTYSGTMVPDNEGSWFVRGNCNLFVTGYSKLAGIAMDYKGDVKVEFTVQ